MRTTYKTLAYAICVLVAVQAAAHAWSSAGLGVWIDDGGVLDQATFENVIEGGETPFPEIAGLMIHAINGMMVIPVVALALLVIAFFVRGRAVAWAAVVIALVALQITLGLMGHSVPAMGALHGLNALILFAAAFTAARIGARSKQIPPATPSEPAPVAVGD